VKNRDEIFMEGKCPFQNISFDRLFTINVSELSNKRKTTAATTVKEQVKNIKKKKQKTK